jgi:hypothetical protein
VKGAVIGAVAGAATFGATELAGRAFSALADSALPSAERLAVDAAEASTGEATALEDAAQSCSVNSFTAETPVLLASGDEVPISKIHVGDKVLATDPETGKTEARPVTNVIMHAGKHTMVDLTMADGSRLTATDHHPFWDATAGRFTYAIDLRAGEQVREADGTLLSVNAVHAYDEDVAAYNLTVDGIHTYYAGTTPVLVHNSCGNPLEGTRYSQKVLDQAASGDFHSFPEAVDGFAESTHATAELGGDGLPYTHVRIPGGYGDYEGVFHYVFGEDGIITHRLFEPF